MSGCVLNIGVRVGLAFVPQTTYSAYRLSEVEKSELLEGVRTAFLSRPYVASILGVGSRQVNGSATLMDKLHADRESFGTSSAETHGGVPVQGYFRLVNRECQR